MRLKAVIEYDGADFSGWQVQPDKTTVQGEMERALFKITGNQIRITGSGRTDAGVHALGQVASFDYSGLLEPARLSYALNSVLPRGVLIKELETADPGFDARRDAKLKLYRYHIIKGRSPIRRLRAWEYEFCVDVSLMRAAADQLTGTRDYGRFCEIGESKQLTVDSIEILENSDEIVVEVRGRGFLYKMVRRIVGLITDCGRGKVDADVVPELFKAQKPVQVITAPAHGLVLVEVKY